MSHTTQSQALCSIVLSNPDVHGWHGMSHWASRDGMATRAILRTQSSFFQDLWSHANKTCIASCNGGKSYRNLLKVRRYQFPYPQDYIVVELVGYDWSLIVAKIAYAMGPALFEGPSLKSCKHHRENWDLMIWQACCSRTGGNGMLYDMISLQPLSVTWYE